MVEKWVSNAREEVNAKVQSRLETEKVVRVLRQEKESLFEKVKEAIQARDNVEVGLKTTERQVKDMR